MIMRFLLLALLALFAHPVAAPAQAPDAALRDKFAARVFEDGQGGRLLYRLLQPPAYDSTRRYPLVLFLHGAGERGSNNVAQLKNGVLEFAKDDLQARYPAFVVVPQVPQNNKWSDTDWRALQADLPPKPSDSLRMTMELLKALREEFSIDGERIYVTGVSMGGYGTWDAICRYPGFFAAAAPVCGGGDEKQAELIKDLPIWCFHGDKDSAVPVVRSRNMIEALRQAGGAPKYTELPGVGHNAWDYAYGDPALFDWLFAQKQGAPAAP